MILKFIPLLLVAVLIFFSTPWGLGLLPDSISYATASRGLAEHGDIMGLPSHWPPLYALLIAVSHTLMGDSVLGSRLLHTLLFALNSVLLVLLFRDLEKKSILFSIFPLLIVLQPDFVTVHLYLLSEPIFIALALSNLLILKHVAVEDGISLKSFLFLALTAGLATMARYAGLFLILVNTVAILLLARMPDSEFSWSWALFSEKWCLPDWISSVVVRRIWLASMVAVLSLIPMASWMLFNLLRGSKGVNRDIVLHLPGPQHMVQFSATLADWFHVPRDFGWLFILILVICVLWAFIQRTQALRMGDFKARSLVLLSGLFIAMYILFLLASITLADYQTPLDGRILVPILPVVMVLIAHLFSIAPGKRVSLLLLVVIMSLLALNVSKSVELMLMSKKNGMGFANRNIQEMQIIGAVRKLPSRWYVFTNGPELFSLYLSQSSNMFPRKVHPGTQLNNEHYTAQMEGMRRTADALVYFTTMKYRYYLPDASELNGQEAFHLVYSQIDGAIWVRDEKINEYENK